MQISRNRIVLILLLTASFAAGYLLRHPAPPQGAAAARRPLYYHDPMHPSYKSDKPGIAPDCGMALEPVYAEDVDASGAALPPGAVRINVEKQQIMGLRTEPVRKTAGSHTLRVLGRVAADESRINRVTALAEGVVRSVSRYAEGDIVRKDEILANYFVSMREVYSAIQSYFVAMNTLDQGVSLKNDPNLVDQAKAQVRLSEELLLTYGVTEAQLRELARTRQATRDIEFRAPFTGLILSRNVAMGQKVTPGTELFRLADLSHVWVLADLFESDSGLIRPHARARVRYGGRTFRATVSDALPQFDKVTRTLKLRLELDNPDLVLRPDMFVDVEFDVQEPDGISVPSDAVLDTGTRKVVFVSPSEGVFEPRIVTTGKRYGERVQIASGLEAGENVVVSGLFLLDSESRLQLAASAGTHAAMPVAMGSVTDPVCGMKVDPEKTTHRSEYQGTNYYFCSKDCKARFDRNPGQYVRARQTDTAMAGGA